MTWCADSSWFGSRSHDCAIRCSSIEVGRQKLQHNLDRQALDGMVTHSSRVIPVLSELSERLLCLSAAKFQLAG